MMKKLVSRGAPTPPEAQPPGRRSRSRKAVAAAAAVAFSFAASLVLAEWLATGTGEGYARAGVAQPLSTESATAAPSLHPGGTGDLVLRVVNPNQFQVNLTTVSPNGPISSDNATCDAAGHGVSFAGYSGSHPLAAQSTTELVLADVLTMASASANECQGAAFTVPVSLNGGSGGTGTTAYLDNDLDGFGDPATAIVASIPPTGYISDGTDCDDTNPATNPAAPEVAGDGIDNDCDGAIDDGALQLWYPDFDLDGYGNPAAAIVASSPPAGHIADGTDCNDTNSTVNPAAPEVAGDGIDNDCDGTSDEL